MYPIQSETLPVSEYYHPIYQSLPLDHFETPRHVCDLIRDSKQHSATKSHNSYNTNRHRTLSVQTLRVRELCRHDRDSSPVNNQQWNLDAHIGSYIFYEDLYRSNRYDKIHNSLCLLVCYLHEIRSSVSSYLVQFRYRQVFLLVP